MNRKEFIKGVGAAAGAATSILAAGCGAAGGENTAGKGNPTFLDLAKGRFSVRYYANTPVEQEKIDAILEAARVAPTAKNLQPFHIYVPIAVEYPWGALRIYTQTAWAVITVDPTVGNE